MSGILLTTGQIRALNILLQNTAVDTTLYLALMTQTANPAVGSDVGSGIAEVTGTGYARIAITRNTDWSGGSNIKTALTKDFTVGAGGWTNCNGYFIAYASSGTNAIWAEAFPAGSQGSRVAGDIIHVTCNITLKDVSQ